MQNFVKNQQKLFIKSTTNCLFISFFITLHLFAETK